MFFAELMEKAGMKKGYIVEKIPFFNTYNEFYDKHHSFIFNYCVETIYITTRYRDEFFKKLELKLNDEIKRTNINVVDCLLRSCMFSFGYQTAKTPLMLLDSHGNPIRIEQMSSQLQTFQNERAISPLFHLYYLPRYNQRYNTYDEVDKKQLLLLLVKIAVQVILN